MWLIKCQTQTQQTIIFIEDKYVEQESTSQKLTLSMVVGVGPHCYLLPDCTTEVLWMIRDVVSGKECHGAWGGAWGIACRLLGSTLDDPKYL